MHFICNTRACIHLKRMCKEPVQSCVLKGPLDTFPETPAPRAARLVDTNYQPNWTCASPKSLSIYTCCVYIHTRTCIRRHPARRFESVAIMPKLIYIYTCIMYLSIYLCIYVPMYIICIIMYIRISVYMSICKDVYMYIYIHINV